MALLLCLFLLGSVSAVHADTVVTEGTFNLDLNLGEAFSYQDLSHAVTITFIVGSGNLNGTATLNVNDADGALIVTPDSTGTLLISTNNPSVVTILVNGALVYSYSYSVGNQFQVTWTYGYPYIPPIIISGPNATYYMRSDTFQTNNVTGYGLHPENTAVYATSLASGTGDVSVSFGFRIWVVNSRYVETELSDGSPVATVTRTMDGAGFQNETWNCPRRNLALNFDALKVVVYVKFGSGDWQVLATFVTQTLLETAIEPSAWAFSVYTSRVYSGGDTDATFVFGSLARNSRISGITFTHPTPQEIALALGLAGDWVQMILYPFMYMIGNLFYGAGMLFLSVTYYLRFKRWEPVLIMVLLFGGGGLFGYLIPNIAYRLVYIVVLFVIATQLYRVFN